MREMELALGIDALRGLIEESDNVVAFTGAGISTESGIPDFRSPNGLWTKHSPIEFQDFMASEDMRREAWRRKFAMDGIIGRAVPNAGHRAIAALYRRGKIKTVITQNIDGLHQTSGVPEENVIELHGNTTYAKCLECGLRHELAWVREVFSQDESLPLCTACGGIVKTATISFGQAMPLAAMAAAESATAACDLFLAIGSSLVVYPAAGFPLMAKERGARMAIVNREEADQDPFADLVIHGEIGAVLAGATGFNG